MSKKNNDQAIYQEVIALNHRYLEMIEQQIQTVKKIIQSLNQLIELNMIETNAGSQTDEDNAVK